MNPFGQRYRTFLAAVALVSIAMPSWVHAEAVADNQAETIIAAMMEAYGGKDAVSKVRTVVAKGSINDFIKGKRGDYARYFARPQKLRIEIMPDQGGEVRLLDGMRGWQGSPEVLKEARPVTLQSMIYQYAYLDLPMGLSENIYKISYGGKREHRGQPVDLLLIDVSGAPQLRVYVDREKRLILRVAADFNMGMGSGELVTEYENFSSVNKVLFPYRLTNYAGERKLSAIYLSEITVNNDIPALMFTPGTQKDPKGATP